MGWRWEARLEERFAKFQMDGVEGWGISEWNYRHHGGRPDVYAQRDPEHLKEVEKY